MDIDLSKNISAQRKQSESKKKEMTRNESAKHYTRTSVHSKKIKGEKKI
jgi:hypothetical protein